MQIIRDLNDLPEAARGGSVAIGNFDGVHQGHLSIARRLRAHASALGEQAVVFTFDPHPVRVLRPERCPPPLTWTERKAELLVAEGVDWMVAYPTDLALLELSAREFFDKIIVELLDARAIVEGPNFFFGKGREGDIALLRQFAGAAGIEMEVAEPIIVDGDIVSSSRIRQLIERGDVKTAEKLLAAPYRLRGLVTHGAGRGVSLGFPTANLDGVDTLRPAHGVYAGLGRLGSDSWPAAIHIGPNPTFGAEGVKIEVHLVGPREPMYGQVVEVDFYERVRDIRAFGSAEELTLQITRDVKFVEAIVAARA